jgi:hypothetical protein
MALPGLISIIYGSIENFLARRLQTSTPVAGEDAANKNYVDNESYSSRFDKTWIGCPRYWRSTVLPADHCWANGDCIPLADWPELAEVYFSGGFEGLLLPWNADNAAIAANLGMWRPNAASPTGLYVPNLGDQFFRNWRPGLSREAGSWQQDAICNITGYFNYILGPTYDAHLTVNTANGVFSKANGPLRLENLAVQGTSQTGYSGVNFNASQQVSTGPQNVPQHVMQPCILYLGRHAEV